MVGGVIVVSLQHESNAESDLELGGKKSQQ